MKFSVCLATGYEGLAYPIPFCEPADLVKAGVWAEKLGYDAVWGNDHITTQEYVRKIFKDPPNFYDVLITMAMIAQATTRLRVGAGLLVLPMREPVMLYKQITTIDQISGGRFMMAVGIGAYREEYEAWRGNRFKGARRGDMLDEGLEALRILDATKVSTYEGRHFSFKDLEMFPKFKQQPFPLYIGGHNMESLERAAKLGRGWLPGWRPHHEIAERIAIIHRRAAELGRDPKEIEIAPQFSMLIGKTQEAAVDAYMKSGSVAHRVSLAYTGRDPKYQVEANLVGTPQSIIDKLGKLKEMGVDHCAAMVLAVNTHQEFMDQMQWFAEEIMPHAR
jgi:probable F420-dependent oxidoreductase